MNKQFFYGIAHYPKLDAVRHLNFVILRMKSGSFWNKMRVLFRLSLTAPCRRRFLVFIHELYRNGSVITLGSIQIFLTFRPLLPHYQAAKRFRAVISVLCNHPPHHDARNANHRLKCVDTIFPRVRIGTKQSLIRLERPKKLCC
jgi:hypothetical protein